MMLVSVFSHQGHDIPVSARVPRQSASSSQLAFKCCVAVANTGCRNNFHEGLITTNPLKSGRRCGVAYLRNANRGCLKDHVSPTQLT